MYLVGKIPNFLEKSIGNGCIGIFLYKAIKLPGEWMNLLLEKYHFSIF